MPDAVRRLLPSLVRVVWEDAEGTRTERMGYVDRLGYVGALLPDGERPAPRIVDAEGREHAVTGVAAVTGMAGARFGSPPRGLLVVDWDGERPPGARVLSEKPAEDARLLALRRTDDGPFASELLMKSESGWGWSCTAAWDELNHAQEVIIVTEQGAIAGHPVGFQAGVMLAPSVFAPSLIETAAQAALHGATIDVLLVDRDRDLRVEDMTWEAFSATAAATAKLRREIDELIELSGDDPRGAELRARELTQRHPDHPMAWAALAKFAKKSGDEAGAILALERAVDADPFDLMLTLRLGHDYLVQRPRDYAGLRRLETPLKGWSDTVAQVNWYLCVIAREAGRRDEAEAYLAKAVRMDPGEVKYATDFKSWFGR